MPHSQKFFLNSSIAYLGSFGVIGLGMVSKVLLAYVLSPAEMGIFFTAQIFFGMLIFVASLGMPDAVARFVGFHGRDDFSKSLAVLVSSLRWVLILGAVIAVSIALFAPMIADYFNQASAFSAPVIFIALAIPFKLAADLMGSANQGVGRLYLKLLINDLMPAILFILGLGGLLAYGQRGLDKVVYLYFLSFFIMPFLFPEPFKFWAIFRQGIASVTIFRDLLRYALPLLLSGIVAWPMALIPVVIGRMTSAESVAYYSLSISLASFIYIGASATEAAGLSVWSSYLGVDEKQGLKNDYRRSTRWGIIVGSIVFAPLFMCPRQVVVFLFDVKYEPVARILPVMSVLFFMNLLTGPVESILKAYGDTRFIFLTRLSVGAVVLLSLYPFLLFWGLEGAVAAYGLSSLVGGIGLYSWRLYALHRLHPVDKYYLNVIVSIGAALFLSWLFIHDLSIQQDNLSVMIGALALYCSLLLLFCSFLEVMVPEDHVLISRMLAVPLRYFKQVRDDY